MPNYYYTVYNAETESTIARVTSVTRVSHDVIISTADVTLVASELTRARIESDERIKLPDITMTVTVKGFFRTKQGSDQSCAVLEILETCCTPKDAEQLRQLSETFDLRIGDLVTACTEFFVYELVEQVSFLDCENVADYDENFAMLKSQEGVAEYEHSPGSYTITASITETID
jgi:hypothetical protein